MPMVMPEWKEFIKARINAAWHAGELKTFEDFDRIAREACQSIPIQNKTLAARAISAVKVSNPVKTVLRQKAAEINLPITDESLVEDLPISNRARYALERYFRRHLAQDKVAVGDLISFLKSIDRPEEGFMYIDGIGRQLAEEIYEALKWAGIEIPPALEEAEAEEDISNNGEGLESWRLVRVDDTRERKIVLHEGESFTKEFSPLDGRVAVLCEGQELIISAKKVTITAAG